MQRKIIHITFVVCLMTFFYQKQSLAQDESTLENKKSAIRKNIQYASALLDESGDSSLATYQKLLLYNKKIEQRNEILAAINAELDVIDTEIHNISVKVQALEIEIKEIKDEYAKMIYFAYRNHNPFDRLIYILSSKSFNQSYKRLKYLQQYSDYRRKQAQKLIDKKEALNKRLIRLKIAKAKRENLLLERKTEAKILDTEKTEAVLLRSKLLDDKKTLMNKAAQSNEFSERLRKTIHSVIDERVEIYDKNAKQAITKQDKVFKPKIPVSTFSSSQGILAWPVTNGLIYSYYGVHRHPVLPDVTIKNNGVDIITKTNEDAYAVFTGTVTRVVAIPGGNHAVLIAHDNDYFTVYSNLVDVSVKKGDKVYFRQRLGKIYTDKSDEGKTILKFQIWHKHKTLDPINWLVPKQ